MSPSGRPESADPFRLEREVDALCDSFEEACLQGGWPDLDAWLPTDPELRRIALPHLAVLDLERRVRRGDAVRVEDFFHRYPELQGDQEAALTLMAAEARVRLPVQPGLAAAEYLGRLPHPTDRLDGKALSLPSAAGLAASSPPELVAPPRSSAIEPRPGARPVDEAVAVVALLEPPRTAGELGRLGGFGIRSVLGAGGMGVVLRAEEEALGRPVALKVLRPELMGDPESRQRFLREARLMAALEHERVVPIWRVDEANGVPFFAMPLLQGQTLWARLKDGPPLSLTEVLRLGREVAEGLAGAHTKGQIHRDIKPANLWLRGDGGDWHVLILDFGLAHSAASTGHSQQGRVLGTPAYMAPEQVRGAPLDARCDLFSLGCVLYEALTRSAPFAGPTVVANLYRVARHHPPPPQQLDPRCPRALSALVMQLLAKDRNARPSSAGEVVAALRNLEDTLDPPRQPPGPAASPAPAGAATAVTTTAPAVAPRAPVPAPGKPTRARRAAQLLRIGIALVAVASLALLPQCPGPDMKGEPPTKGWIDVVVYAPDNARRRYIFLDDSAALPLRPGDEIVIQAEVNRPAYLYILWIETSGEVLPIYPWRNNDWKERPGTEFPVVELRQPEEWDMRYPMTEGAPGMETLVLLARQTPLPPTVDLRAELGALPAQPAQELQAAVWFENGKVIRNRRDRAGRFDVTRRADPVLLTQQQIQEKLRRHFAYTLAVSFAWQGK